MDIDTACEVLERFARANELDNLTALEVMVRHYRAISTTERRALGVFMDFSKKMSNKSVV